VRKRYLAGALVGVLALALATVALASPSFKQTVSAKYTKKSGKTQKKGKVAAGLNASLKATDPGATPPGNQKTATKVTVQANGAKVDFKGSALCTLPAAQAVNCPASTNVGTGSVVANTVSNATPPTVSTIHGSVTAYLRQGGVFLVIKGQELPITLVLDATLTTKAKLTVDVQRDVLNQPAFTGLGLKPVLTDFSLKFKLKKRKVAGKTHTVLRTPKCGKSKKFKFTSKFVYDDTTTKTIVKKQTCKK
jgi:hypothetical protein